MLETRESRNFKETKGQRLPKLENIKIKWKIKMTNVIF